MENPLWGAPRIHGELLKLGFSAAINQALPSTWSSDAGLQVSDGAPFLDCIYGFQPGRNPHHALQALRLQIVSKKVNHVIEVDIRSYFTRISHQWLRKMVAYRIADLTILKLTGKMA